jgi:hypothetical protein
MAVRKAALRPFDTNLRGDLHCDLEATLSVSRRGWKVIWDPEVAVDHYPAPGGLTRQVDARTRRGRTQVREQAHNETYVLVKLLPWWQKPIVAAYTMGVGTRQAPGLALCAVGLLRGRRRRDVLLRFAAATGGRILAAITLARLGSPLADERRRVLEGHAA